MNHEKIFFSCKKFEYNKNTQNIVALGHVNFQDKDKKIETNHLIYNIRTNQGYFNNGGVITILNHKLKTKDFFFNKKTNEGYFKNGGIITDLSTGNIIKSQSGYISIPKKIYTFNKLVTIQNKNYIIQSNKIIIHDISKHINFIGPTIIRNKKYLDNYIYTEKGYLYNNNNFVFKKQSKIYYNNTIITGKYIYYNHKNQYGKILGDLCLKSKNYIIKGEKGEFFKSKNSIIITKKPYAINYNQKKTVCFSADTLIIIQNKYINNINKYIIHGLKNVRFFQSNIQGICDSIKIDELQEILEFYKNPIIWIDTNQITSDKIIGYLNIKNKNLDSIYFINNAFLINPSNFISKREFNQIKSDNIIVYLTNNKIFQILSIGNSKSIIHIYQNNNKIGINKTKSNISIININNNQIKNILYKMYVESTLYPNTITPKYLWYLKNFKWRNNERLIKCNDIFIKKMFNLNI